MATSRLKFKYTQYVAATLKGKKFSNESLFKTIVLFLDCYWSRYWSFKDNFYASRHISIAVLSPSQHKCTKQMKIARKPFKPLK